MSSEDFRLIKPVPLTSVVPFTRPSPKWVYDRTGTLVQVPANTLGVTYDPADLSKAPWALLESAATNRIRNNTMAGAVMGVPFVDGSLPANWQLDTTAAQKVQIVQVQDSSGISFIDIRFFSTNNDRSYLALYPEPTNGTGVTGATAGQVWAGSMYAEHVAGTLPQNNVLYVRAIGPAAEVGSWGAFFTPVSGGKQLRSGRVGVVTPALPESSERVTMFYLASALPIGGAFDFTIRIGLPQLERDKVTSPIKTSNGAVTRAADVVGAGSGLVYSNVPITEPLWMAGTYAQGTRVRDAANFVFESLADGNTSVLSEKTKWLPLGITNRLKMFDKAVNSQTVWPEEVVVVVKAAQLANTLTLLNVTGASVSVSQSESTYSRARSLVSHDVISWYDFWYQEPLWIGDVVFDDLPPYIESVVTVAVRSPSNQAAVGGFFLGKSKFIGKTQWGLTAGILSYSGAIADTFGNVTLMKRDSAKKMNFEVAIPRGYEDEVYRYMKSAENIEMVAIASTNWSMTISYGYLGQWEIPLSIDGKKMPVEWRGLI